MSDIAVIYKSHYGFTEAYARWIAEDLSADLLEAGAVRAADLAPYRVLVFGGGLYAGGVGVLPLLTKHFGLLKDKALYLFTVGAADVADPKNIASIRRSLAKVLTPEMLDRVRLFHFRGGLRYSEMSLLHRTMMSMLRGKLLKTPEDRFRPEDRMFLETYGQDVSFLDRDAIAPLVQEIRQLCEKERAQ